MSERMSDRLVGFKIEFMVVLGDELAKRFITAAEQRQVRPVDLAANILETVIKDDLFAAVLDG
jgi:hypothetical protein